MGQRGRKSAAAKETAAGLSVLPSPVLFRPEPPAALDARGKRRWSEIVANYPADYFRPADLGLLENFVWVEGQLDSMRARVRREGVTPSGKRHPLLMDIHQYLGNIASLAVKLRLCPSTRMKEDHGGVNRPAAGAKPAGKSTAPPWAK